MSSAFSWCANSSISSSVSACVSFCSSLCLFVLMGLIFDRLQGQLAQIEWNWYQKTSSDQPYYMIFCLFFIIFRNVLGVLAFTCSPTRLQSCMGCVQSSRSVWGIWRPGGPTGAFSLLSHSLSTWQHPWPAGCLQWPADSGHSSFFNCDVIRMTCY